MIASFDDATTAAFKARAPEIHTTPGLAEVLAFVGQPGPLPDHLAFQVPRTFEGIEVAPLIIDPAHANGLAVYFFIDPDEETEEVYNELIDAGADGIITDEPTALQAVLEQRGAAFHHDQPAALKVALVKSSRALKFVSRRAFASPRVAPPETASSLSVDANGGNMTDPLTAGSWKLLGKPEAPKGWKYVNPNAPVGGACKVVLVKATSLKAVCKDKGSIPDPLPPTMNGDVLMSLSLGIDRYCVAAQAPHAVEKAGAVIKAKDQPAPPGCDAP